MIDYKQKYTQTIKGEVFNSVKKEMMAVLIEESCAKFLAAPGFQIKTSLAHWNC